MQLDPLSEESDDGLIGNERDIAKDTAREKLADKRPDPLLHESAAILTDTINLLEKDQILSAQVLLQSTTPGHWAN